MKKQEACLFLEKKGILFDVRMSVVEPKQLVRSYIAENEKEEIICLAKLIELAWTYIKGKVG
jgi:hypothetical protein